MRLLAFACGHLALMLGLALIAVFGFDSVEPDWGRAGSLAALAVASIVATLIATLSFGATTAISRRRASAGINAVLGACAALFSLGGLLGAALMVNAVPLAVSVITFALFGLLVALMPSRKG